MMKSSSFSGLILALPRILAILLVLLGCSRQVAAKSNVLVHIPFQFHNASSFQHVQAEFGYSAMTSSPKSLAEFVYYVEAALCRPIHNANEGHPAHESWMKPPFILMAEPGSCSDVLKARNAQTIGASALLIADKNCLCSDRNCVAKYGNETTCTQDADAVLVDDGSGGDITIPTFLIFRDLAQDLKTHLKNNQTALVELQWGLPECHMETKVPHFHMYTTAYDPLVSLEFYVDLHTVVKAFQGKVAFAPRFSLIDGHRFHCNTEPDENAPCDHMCTNHGRYCTKHATELSGHAIVRETLNRLCIWKHYGNTTADKYWDYVIYHKQLCAADPHSFADPKCIGDALKVAGINHDIVESCVRDAGDLDVDGTNALLEDELHHMETSGVHSLPALTVNRKVLHWTTAHGLFETLCTEYWLSDVQTVPEVCTKCSSCPNAVGCLEKGKCVEFDNSERHPDTGYKRAEEKKGGHGWKFFWFLTFIGTVGGAYYYYDQNRDRFVNRRGGGMLNDYMQLHGEG